MLPIKVSGSSAANNRIHTSSPVAMLFNRREKLTTTYRNLKKLYTTKAYEIGRLPYQNATVCDTIIKELL